MLDKFDLTPHLPRLHRYARSLTRDWARAEDLVQDTVVRAIEKAHLFDDGTNLRGWLVTIMHNEYVNAARRHMRGPVMVPEAVLDGVGRQETQSAPIELREIQRAVGRLPSEQRRPLVLHWVQGRSYGEIAEALDLPIGTVQSRISRGRKVLRRMIEDPTSQLGLAHH